MRLISRAVNFTLDFFFPKNPSLIRLESLSSEDLLKALPTPPPTESKDTVVLFDYQHELVREMIWELKYKGNNLIAKKFGELLLDLLVHELSEHSLFNSDEWTKNRPLLIPIPISDKRRFERGWNQSELLAEAIVSLDKNNQFKYLPRQLVKTIHTESQTKTSSKTERIKNTQGTMRVLHPPSVEGRYVVLIDDVTTTGATFKEAKRALKEAGVKKVLCVAVAH